MYGVMRIKIEFEVELPDISHSQDELEEYIRFHFGDGYILSRLNPFHEKSESEPEPVYGSFKWRYK